jgi:hypothetical protein
LTVNCVFIKRIIFYSFNRIGGVMVSVLESSVVDRGFEPRAGQTKDYIISICCFSAEHVALT